METTRTIVFWAVIIVSALLLWQFVRTGGSAPLEPEISYSRFLAQIGSGQVSKVTIAGNVVHGYDEKSAKFRVIAPANQSAMVEALQQHDVEIWFKEAPEGTWSSALLNLAPLVLLGALWFFMIRQMRKVGKHGISTPAQSGSTPPSESPTSFGR